MKKALSLALAIVFAFALAIPTFAADIQAEGQKEVTATYNVQGHYTVTIPDNITVNTGASVVVKDVLIASTETLTVTVESGNNFELINSGDSLTYTLSTKVGEGEAQPITAQNKVVISVEAGDLVGNEATSTATLTFAVQDSPKYMGEYGDTLTFNITVE